MKKCGNMEPGGRCPAAGGWRERFVCLGRGMRLALFAGAVCAASGIAGAEEVTPEQRTPYRGDLELVLGSVTLPEPGGAWYVVNQEAAGPVRHAFLLPDDKPSDGAGAEYGPRKPGAAGAVRYRVVGILAEPGAKRATLHLKNWESGATLDCGWNLAAKPSQVDADGGAAEVAWRTAMEAELYGKKGAVATAWRAALGVGDSQDAEDARERHTTNLFNVLGGRAAVEETLQLQALAPESDADGRTVPVAQIPGVEVKAHPYAEMLGRSCGGRIAIADAVPADRLFIYVGKPAALLPLLDTGANFLGDAGGMLTRNGADYDLKGRYLGRMGVDEKFLRAMLSSGLVAEVALFLPDLFLIEGTDITAVLRVPNVRLFAPVLKTAGVADLKDGALVQIRTGTGGTAFWARAGELLVAGGNRGEVERALALCKAGGEGSLGRSAEFRYMLTQLAPDKGTRAFVYISDPFIRRLTGPAVKIGQCRRLKARAALEAVNAAALLYKWEGHTDAPTLEKLVAGKYLPDSFAKAGITLRPDLAAESATWGTVAHPATLLDMPVVAASPAEEAAYRHYLSEYDAYWRQFFDPIAIRLDELPDGRLELTTFILPLIDNSIYNSLKEALPDAKSAPPLRRLAVTPTPILHATVNFKRELLEGKDFNMDDVIRQLGAAAGVFRHIRPPLHFWVQDADPVVALGCGDLLGAFGGEMDRMGSHGEMLVIPLYLSMFTRPCAAAVEVDDPAAVRRLLNAPQPPPATGPGRRLFNVTLTKARHPGRDAWLLDWRLEDVISVHFGLELQGKYLVLSNVPWAQRFQLATDGEKLLNAASLEVHPEAVGKQLPALFTVEMGMQRAVALAGLDCLEPVMQAEGGDVAAAQKRHLLLFGYTPRHPAGGDFVWKDGGLSSDRFGTRWQPMQPEYTPGDTAFGLFQGVGGVTLSMQFEETGLRTRLTWQFTPPAAPTPTGK